MSSSYQVTILCDNNSKLHNNHNDKLMTEHGLCMAVFIDNVSILFDTGSGKTLEHNARLLEIDLSVFNYLVLSHGHYDHTGGVNYFLTQNDKAKIIAHSNVYCQRYSVHEDKPIRTIGMPECIKDNLQDNYESRITLHESVYHITNTVTTCGFIPRLTNYEDTGGGLYLDVAGALVDHINDDQSMVIKTNNGLVIILGCCHSGIENTICYIRSVNQNQPVIGVIGGLHLANACNDRIERTLQFLRQENLEFLYLGHCTGNNVIAYLQESLPNAHVKMLYVGMKID